MVATETQLVVIEGSYSSGKLVSPRLYVAYYRAGRMFENTPADREAQTFVIPAAGAFHTAGSMDSPDWFRLRVHARTPFSVSPPATQRQPRATIAEPAAPTKPWRPY